MIDDLVTLSGRYLRPRPLDADAREAFGRFAREATIRHGLLTAVMYGGFLTVLWPTDPYVLDGDRQLMNAFSLYRQGQIATCVLMAAALILLPPARRRPGWTYGAFATVGVVLGAAAGSRMGGLDEPWFYGSYLLPFAWVPAMIPIRARCFGTLWTSILWIFCWFTLRPDDLQFHLVSVPVVFLFFASGLAIAAGHGVWLLAREVFATNLELAEQRSQLASFNAELSQRVDARTAELRTLASHVDQLHEKERHRLASELHDGTGQHIAALRIELDLAHTLGEATGSWDLDGVSRQVDEVATALREVLHDLRPRILDDEGLAEAARQEVARVRRKAGFVADLQVDLPERLPPELELRIYRVLQEALTNVLKHADAGRVAVTLSADDARAILTVEDDGKGLTLPEGHRGLGLLGMQERAAAGGGKLTLDSSLLGGTRVMLVLPMADGL